MREKERAEGRDAFGSFSFLSFFLFFVGHESEQEFVRFFSAERGRERESSRYIHTCVKQKEEGVEGEEVGDAGCALLGFFSPLSAAGLLVRQQAARENFE